MVHIYTMEYYASITNTEIRPFATTTMDPEIRDYHVSEVSQTEKDKYCMIITDTWNLKRLQGIPWRSSG